MQKMLAFVCSMMLAVACTAGPEEAAPEAVEAAEAAAPSTLPPSPSAVGAYADEPCLNYCMGGRVTPFMTCVPVCRKAGRVIFPPEPVVLQIVPQCGDKICQYPEELYPSNERFCPQDCRLRVEVTRNRLFIEGKLVAEIQDSGLTLTPSAFDAPM